MDVAIAITIFCSIFSSPDLHLSKARKKTACKSLEHVYKESKKSQLSPTLVMSMIFVESGWQKTAVSRANACGLTQVLPRYTGKITKKYSCNQLKVPKTSIMVGTRTLKWWIEHYRSNLTKLQKSKMSSEDIEKHSIARGLCGYNAGFRCNGKNPSRLGMKYAKKVLKFKKNIESKAASFIE